MIELIFYIIINVGLITGIWAVYQQQKSIAALKRRNKDLQFNIGRLQKIIETQGRELGEPVEESETWAEYIGE